MAANSDLNDFDGCESSVSLNRAQRRDRDAHLAQVAYTKNTEKKEAKRMAKSILEKTSCHDLLEGPESDSHDASMAKQEDPITPTTPLKSSKKRETSGSVGPKVLKSEAAIADENGLDARGKNQRIRSKSSGRRQRDFESGHCGRRTKGKAAELEDEEDKEWAAAAEAAAARRRAVWESKKEAREAAMRAEAMVENEAMEVEAEAALLKALEAEAGIAAAAAAKLFASQDAAIGGLRISKVREIKVAASLEFDAELEGWEIL